MRATEVRIATDTAKAAMQALQSATRAHVVGGLEGGLQCLAGAEGGCDESKQQASPFLLEHTSSWPGGQDEVSARQNPSDGAVESQVFDLT